MSDVNWLRLAGTLTLWAAVIIFALWLALTMVAAMFWWIAFF